MAFFLILPLWACASSGGVQAVPQPGIDRPQSGRQVAVTARVRVVVEDLTAAADQVSNLVSGAGGFIASARTDPGDKVEMEVRVPAQALEGVLSRIRAVGDVTDESVATTDRTDQMLDLGARLQNLLAVRDRLRGYLEDTESVEEVIAVERELTRVQSEIDTLSGQLERLENDVAMSQLALQLHRKRALGPLGAIGYGIVWTLRKLVIWN